MKKEIITEGKELTEIMLELGYVPDYIIRLSDGEKLYRNNDNTYSFHFSWDKDSFQNKIGNRYHFDITKKLSDPEFFKVEKWILKD